MFANINKMMKGVINEGPSLLNGHIPAATLEGLTRGELFVPYSMLLQQIDKSIAEKGELEILALSYKADHSIVVKVRHAEFGEGTLDATPLDFDVTLKDATMCWKVEVAELKADSVKNKLLARVAQWFPQKVLEHLLDEKSVADGIKTKVEEGGMVEVEMTEYLQSLPLAKKKLPLINQSPLEWIRLSKLTAEPEGIRIRCGLMR